MIRIARYVTWIGTFLLVCLTASGFITADKVWAPALFLHEFAVAHRAALMIATGSVVLLCNFAGDWGEAHAVRKRVLRAVLDALHNTYFKDVEPEKKHRHRVTLFRCRRLLRTCWWGRCLKVYCRAGKHPGSRTTLKVNDSNPGKCEGVAGYIWYIDATHTRKIRAWPEDPSDHAGQKAYAAEGGLNLKKARALQVKSRVFSGVIVRSRNGAPWGVLLVDSLTEGHTQRDKEDILAFYGSLLGKLV